jgi:hypothetical protein
VRVFRNDIRRSYIPNRSGLNLSLQLPFICFGLAEKRQNALSGLSG